MKSKPKTFWIALACHGSMVVHSHWSRRALLRTLPEWMRPIKSGDIQAVKVREVSRSVVRNATVGYSK